MVRTDDIDLLHVTASVEAIARFSEVMTLRRSPFHLNACGGCGVPSFQQPCSLCGHYPMGEKPVLRQRPFEDFAAMIERSGPGEANGTIATWHAREEFRSVAWMGRPETVRKETMREHVAMAAAIDVADARTVWDIVVGSGKPVLRQDCPLIVSQGWRAVDEILAQVDRHSNPNLSAKARHTARVWVEAAHGEDIDAARSALAAIRSVALQMPGAGRNGNILYAIKIIDEIPAETPSIQP